MMPMIVEGWPTPSYTVRPSAFSWGHKLSVEDPSGQEVAFIAQTLLVWGPTYEIRRDGDVAAIVKKHLWTMSNARFSVDVPGPNDLEASGDFLAHEYEITRGGDVVARVSKQWFTLTDTYGVDVAEGEDDVLVLCVAIVIDLCCHPDRR